MNKDKMYLINKLFKNKTIRTVWDKEKEKYFISIVDLIEALTESKRPRKYWSDLKKKLLDEGHIELSEKIGQLKLKSSDNKYYLTDVWKDGGITEENEYAILTNEIYKEWSGMTAQEYKDYKGLKKESLRDNMTRIEELLTDLGEEATKELTKEYKPYGLEQNKLIAKAGGNTAKVAKDDLERKLGKTVITNNNNLNYKYINDQQKNIK